MAKNRPAPKLHSEIPELDLEERNIYREQLIRASENPGGEIKMDADQSRPKYYQLALTPSVKDKLTKTAWYNRRSVQSLIMGILLPALDQMYRDIPEEMR